MGLNISKGNMYDFISHTWNVLKGRCLHACIYCFMLALAHRFNNMKDLHLDEAELRVNLGKGNFIFVGSSTDMFAADVPADWILRVLDYAKSLTTVIYGRAKILLESWSSLIILCSRSQWSAQPLKPIVGTPTS